MINKITKELKLASYGNRSFTSSILKEMRLRNIEDIIAEEMIKVVAISYNKRIPLTATCKTMATTIGRLLELPFNTIKDVGKIRTGSHLLDIMAKAELITVKLDRSTGIDHWTLEVIDEELGQYCVDNKKLEQIIDPTIGKQTWIKPYIYLDNSKKVSIVRKMNRYQVSSWYSKDKMPMVYRVLNKLGAVEYQINHKILELALDNQGFQPPMPKEGAKRWMYGVDSIMGKRLEFENVLYYAQQWKDYALNFTYNLDTRGRVYAIQTYLNPQGNDLAKSLLSFNNPKKIAPEALMVHISNTAGNDKVSFEDRIQWVKDNINTLYTIASDPWANLDALAELGIYVNEDEQEKKTKWQFLAAIIELKRYIDEGQPEEFLTNIPIGLDSTASGSQILSGLARDEVAAPFVNITKTSDGNVGNLYQYVWDTQMVNRLQSEKGHSDLLDAIIDETGIGHKVGRKMVKRPVMCRNYGGTQYGMINMYCDDKADFGPLGSKITFKEAKVLGELTFKSCDAALKGAADLMKYMQEGIQYAEDKAIIYWDLPTGFRAFIAKDKSKEGSITATIGNRNVSLKYYTWQDKANKVKQKNAISPSAVHSMDSWLLMEIVDNMPEDANIMVIHDQFGTDGCYVDDLQDISRKAFKKVIDRDNFKAMITQAMSKERELPLPGAYDPSEVDSADFFIC